MKIQNSGNFGGTTTTEKLLAVKIFVFITLLSHLCLCDGQALNTAMFEIPSKDQKSYMLKDCRKMASTNVDCQCVYLGRECQKADVDECEKKCSCLDTSAKIFYVKKRYGALCLSVNNLFNAAGFGNRFLIQNPIYKVCARAGTSNLIQHIEQCTFNDISQLWLWTPGNLLMNTQKSTCLRREQKSPESIWLNLSLTLCNSSDLVQKWRCNDMLWWGASLLSGSTNITHAIRYASGAKLKKLAARNIKKEVSHGNIWTVYPSENQSICTARHNEGKFYLNDENTVSQIDMVPLCPHGTCFKKLLTSMNFDNLSNCTMLWEEDYSEDSRPFSIENRENGLYLKWKSDPYTKLQGRTLDLTIECIRNNSKFEEYLFRLGVKDIVFKNVQENHFLSQDDAIVDLDKNCMGNMCLKSITVSPAPHKEKANCVIEWNESTFSRLDGTSVAVKNFTKLLSAENNEGMITLKWNLTDAFLLENIRFNLTFLCYKDEHENATTVEKSFFTFQTRYGFIPMVASSEKTHLYLAIILPIIFVMLIVLVLIITCWIYRRKQIRIKESTSKHNLNSNVESQYSNGGAISDLNRNGISCESVDNPVYEQCAEKKNPAVTIARNKIYECFHEKSATTDLDIYEIPLENFKVRQNKFYEATTPKHSPKPKFQTSDSKSNLKPKPSPKPSPRTSPKPSPKPQPVKTPSRPQHYKVPKVQYDEEQDLYDQPLGFIPSSRRNSEEVTKDEIPLQDLEDTRVASVYDKPLPDSPQESGIYEYATREDLSRNSNYCPAEKPFEFTKDHGGSLTSNGSMYDAPHYDVLERN